MSDGTKALILATLTFMVLPVLVHFPRIEAVEHAIVAFGIHDDGSRHLYSVIRDEIGTRFFVDGQQALQTSRDRRNSRNCGHPGENKICEWE